MTTQFKPGDIVQVVNGLALDGKIGSIVDKKPDFYNDEFTYDVEFETEVFRGFTEDELELVKQSDKPQANVSDLLNKLEAEVQTAQSTLQKLRELLG